MDATQILTDLRAELSRITQAIAALESLGSTDGITPRRGRRPAIAATAPAQRLGRRRMTAAARRRIGEAMKKRWAQRKAASTARSGQAAPKPARARVISAAGRKRIAEAARKMWARRRKAAKAAKA